MLYNSHNVVASHTAVCHQMIVVAYGLQPPTHEEAEISITEVSRRHNFRWESNHPHEHLSLNVYCHGEGMGKMMKEATYVRASLEESKTQA